MKADFIQDGFSWMDSLVSLQFEDNIIDLKIPVQWTEHNSNWRIIAYKETKESICSCCGVFQIPMQIAKCIFS